MFSGLGQIQRFLHTTKVYFSSCLFLKGAKTMYTTSVYITISIQISKIMTNTAKKTECIVIAKRIDKLSRVSQNDTFLHLS
jgi:hypothetical protein